MINIQNKRGVLLCQKRRNKKSDSTLTREQQLERKIELLHAKNVYFKKLRALGINALSRQRVEPKIIHILSEGFKLAEILESTGLLKAFESSNCG